MRGRWEVDPGVDRRRWVAEGGFGVAGAGRVYGSIVSLKITWRETITRRDWRSKQR